MSEAAQLGLWVERHLLSLQAEHIVGTSNLRADWLSRSAIDPAEWQLYPALFHQIVSRFGQPQLDLFASLSNAQLPCFFSRYWTLGDEGTNALCCKWPPGLLYTFPPIPLILKVMQKKPGGEGRGHSDCPVLAPPSLV